jgi:hypothetical protein
MNPLALTVTLCTALSLSACVTETEEDDTIVHNRINTIQRIKAKKVKRPKPHETPFDMDRPTTADE